MNKKTLYLILVVPFVIALLGFTNVLIIKNFVEVDISDIKWKYNDTEGFKVRKEGYLLEAEGVVPEGLKVSEGNSLVWTMNDPESEIARLDERNGNFYLTALKEGEVTLTCSNVKKTKSKSFNAVIYENGAIIVNPQPKGTGYSIAGKRNFGEYDLSYTSLEDKNPKKENAIIAFSVQEFPLTANTNFVVEDKTDNIRINFENNLMKVKILKAGDASITIRSAVNAFLSTTYKIDIIDDGINVYDYKDLMMCTNNSQKGEIVCLQTSLGSKENTFDKNGKYKESNIRLFGNEDGLNFEKEVYKFDSTYNTKYIKQLYGENSTYDDVITGIRVQKDFYGNGFVINGRELTYPNNGQIDQYSGKLQPGGKDLFKGPLTFFSIGNFDAPIVKAFGQDNSLMYIDGNNITVDDLIIECTDKFNDQEGQDTTGNNMYNLEYTGSVVDVLGKNNTIKNSELRNGRTALRVYSSDGFKLQNSLLSTAREFLMKIGCNEYEEIDLKQNVRFSQSGKVFSGDLQEFLTNHEKENLPNNILTGDSMIFETLFNGAIDKNTYSSLNKLQSYLDTEIINKEGETNYDQEITIDNSYFYRSGIYSLAFDTYFNGCFLFNGMPSYIIKKFNSLLPGALVAPKNIGGTMIPSKVNITGDTRFYDWKKVETIDASCLIEERLGEFLKQIGLVTDLTRIDIDEFFPIKSLLAKLSSDKKYMYVGDYSNHYLNTPIAYYGGGLNQSIINYDPLTKDLGDILEVDILQNALLSHDDNMFIDILTRCVPVASGFNSFKFYTNGNYEGTPYLFGKVPDKNDFKNRI